MPKLQPWDLPELRHHIAQYLDQPTLKTCALLNRAWHEEFQPLVWRTFRFTSLQRRPLTEEGMQSIQKNAHWMRKLCAHYLDDYSRIPTTLHATLAHRCQSLVVVDIIFASDPEWLLYMALISVNTKLRRIHLRNRHGYKQFIRAEQLSWILARHSELQLLTIDGSVSVATLHQILCAVPSLDEIHISRDMAPIPPSTPPSFVSNTSTIASSVANQDNNSTITATPSSTVDSDNTTATTFRLKQFTIEDSCEDPALAAVLAKCPNLEALRIPNMTEGVSTELCKVLKCGALPHLRRLTLSADKMQHSLHSAIIDSFPQNQLRHVAIYTASTKEVLRLIDRHHDSLEDVYVRLDEHHALIDFLSRCHRLRQLSIDGDRLVDVRYLLERPWICKQLEIFDVAVGVDRHCKDATLLRHASNEKRAVAYRKGGIRSNSTGGGNPTESNDGGDIPRQEWEQAEVVFMQRLGDLTCLQQIEKATDNFFRPKTSHMDLSWQLTNGLVYLARLSKMERIHLGCEPKHFGEAELEFMKAHWPQLKRLNAYRPLTKEAQNWIQQHWPELTVDEGLFANITLLPE
ncbi:hypothetical protein BGW41_007399 [Actinomortierella wolfii]|nr:hypothetical protein BGW41_007399 [Actinomortierella wolfii]